MVGFALRILNNGNALNLANTTDIILIPKLHNPSNLRNFYPISLCSIPYKIVAKVLTNRLQTVIDKCIDSVQCAFVHGCLITDNILVAYELLHGFKQKRRGRKGFMALKLDMAKAYDRVEWPFLCNVMLRMGFAIGWVDLIIRCITTPSYSVLINGKRRIPFIPSRGLRQGDLFSPFLFLLCSEGLSTLLRMAMLDGSLRRVRASTGGPSFSHLLFTDDRILFGCAIVKDARVIKGVLLEYERCLGQKVNFDKSTAFYSSNTAQTDKYEIFNILGVRESHFMEKYLAYQYWLVEGKKRLFSI